jgi:hypothetical protein
MEAVMKARGARGAQTAAERICLAKLELRKPLTFGGDNDRSCKSTLRSPSRSKLEAHLECMNEAMRRRGDVPA